MKQLKKRNRGTVFIRLLGLLSAGILYSCSRSVPGTEVQLLQESRDQEMSADSEENDWSEPEEEAETFSEKEIWVHVCGQVASPGVYPLEEGSRVFQALEAAGGVLEQGDSSILNLAMVLEDGMRIEVPDRAEAERMKSCGLLSEQAFVTYSGEEGPGALGKNSSGGKKVNLNQAGAEELMTLTGIGKSRAEAIIQYRRESGPFRSIEEIMNVSGIKESAFEKIRNDITV